MLSGDKKNKPSSGEIKRRASLTKELTDKLAELKEKGEDVIGYKSLSVTELNRLKGKYSNIMTDDGYEKLNKKDISKDLGFTLDDEALKTKQDTIILCISNLHMYYVCLAEIVNLADKNKKYNLTVDGKDYGITVSTDRSTITFPYPTKAKYLESIYKYLHNLWIDADNVVSLIKEEAARRAAEEEAAARQRSANKKKKAATKIQALFRGYKARKELQEQPAAAAQPNTTAATTTGQNQKKHIPREDGIN